MENITIRYVFKKYTDLGDKAKIRSSFNTSNILLASASIQHYWWDDIRFVKGQYMKYPHPDRDYYEISPFQELVAYIAQ